MLYKLKIHCKEERDAHLLAGIELNEKCNKMLMLTDKYGWECAEASGADVAIKMIGSNSIIVIEGLGNFLGPHPFLS